MNELGQITLVALSTKETKWYKANMAPDTQ